MDVDKRLKECYDTPMTIRVDVIRRMTMFQLSLGPIDTKRMIQLAALEQQRLREGMRGTFRRPRFRVAGSLSIGGLRLAASCTLDSKLPRRASCDSAT
jgi:hypothetical protein